MCVAWNSSGLKKYLSASVQFISSAFKIYSRKILKRRNLITETQRIFAYLSFIFALLSAFTSVPFGNRFLVRENR